MTQIDIPSPEDQYARKLTEAIRDELIRQSENVYFWDDEDRELFREGEIKFAEFYYGNLPVTLANRFDLETIVQRALERVK